jgi:hypothetical protein
MKTKLQTAPDPELVIPYGLLGLITVVAVGLLIHFARELYSIWNWGLLRRILAYASLGISSMVAVLLIGYTILHASLSLSGEKKWECICGYNFSYFWTEWLHKRKCLAYAVKRT